MRLTRRHERSAVFRCGLAAVVFLAPFVRLAAAAPEPGPGGTAEEARLRRGEYVRQVLLQLIERTDRDGGWPERLARAEGGGPELEYTKPAGLPRPGPRPDGADRDSLYNQTAALRATVVLHEPPDRHAGGGWVGYADGHLEFVAGAEELASSRDQLRILHATIAAHGNPHGPIPEKKVDPRGVTAQLGRELTLKVLDPDGRPAPGALVGARAYFGDEVPPEERVAFTTPPKDRPMVADANGEVTLAASKLFSPTGEGSTYLDLGYAPLYVLNERRQLVALEELRLSEFDGGRREVRLQPGCKVVGEVGSLGLRELGGTVGETEAFLCRPGRTMTRAVFCASSGPQVELLVPPGDYGFHVSPRGCEPVYRYFRVAPGRRQFTLRADVAPRVLPERLVGRPAPELRDIKGWKNGGPLKLADLRGKVVLLDFWGYWCGPCVGSMPRLMELHDELKDKGLVIVAVHDDSLGSVAEMDQKLGAARKDVWGGRDLPFLVALDGGGQTRVAGTGRYVGGATTAAYFVNSFPTTLVIDRTGVVVAAVKLHDPQAREQAEDLIRKLLEAKAPKVTNKGVTNKGT